MRDEVNAQGVTAALALAEEVIALDERATPGPWTTEKAWVITDPEQVNIALAQRFTPEADGAERVLQNAALIARYRTLAPALARALKEAHERLAVATRFEFKVDAERWACILTDRDGGPVFLTTSEPGRSWNETEHATVDAAFAALATLRAALAAAKEPT